MFEADVITNVSKPGRF